LEGNIGYVLCVTVDPNIPSSESRKRKTWWSFET